MVTVSLQEKNGFYHAVVNYKDDNGKRKQKCSRRTAYNV